MTSQPKPCPFCGHKLITIKPWKSSERSDTYYIALCNACQTRQTFSDTESQAIERWNRWEGATS